MTLTHIEVPIVRVSHIDPIPNADNIETVHAFGFRSIARKGEFKVGSLVAYIPEQAIVPDWLLKKIGLEGKLSGAQRNRVKAIKLRGVLSQGILYNTFEIPDSTYAIQGADESKLIEEGDDVSEFLGIFKEEVEVPVKFRGGCIHLTFLPKTYDIENLKRWPNVIEEGTPVRVTEKLHGTQCCIAYVPDLHNEKLFNYNCFVYSKGLGGKGFVFTDTPDNDNNIYVQTIRNELNHYDADHGVPVFVYGEIIGKGVQDLSYGVEPEFRVFDVLYDGCFLSWDHLVGFCQIEGFKMVPALYTGPYTREKMDELVAGNTTFKATHIREGIVITPLVEQYHRKLGRVVLKHINEAYLLRKGGTEFN